MPPNNATTMKRIHREIADLAKEQLGGMTLAPMEENMFQWKGTIPGPEGSPYEGGVFHVNIELMKDYPFSAPKVTLATKIYHMNINERGGICIDILKQNWSPALSLYKVLLSLSSLLTDPNPKDPLVPSIATEYSRNRTKHDQTAAHWTKQYAMPPKPKTPANPSSSQGQSKGKGKAKGEDTVTLQRATAESSVRTRSRRPVQNTVIDLGSSSDVESEVTTASSTNGVSRAGTKRKRGDSPGAVSSTRRRVGGVSLGSQPGDVIVIDD